MRTVVSALMVSAALWAWGLPSVPAQAGEQRAKQGASHHEADSEARDARDDKEATAQDKNTKSSRNTSGLKDTAHQQDVSKHRDSGDSRDARDEKEAGGGSHK